MTQASTHLHLTYRQIGKSRLIKINCQWSLFHQSCFTSCQFFPPSPVGLSVVSRFSADNKKEMFQSVSDGAAFLVQKDILIQDYQSVYHYKWLLVTLAWLSIDWTTTIHNRVAARINRKNWGAFFATKWPIETLLSFFIFSIQCQVNPSLIKCPIYLSYTWHMAFFHKANAVGVGECRVCYYQYTLLFEPLPCFYDSIQAESAAPRKGHVILLPWYLSLKPCYTGLLKQCY